MTRAAEKNRTLEPERRTVSIDEDDHVKNLFDDEFKKKLAKRNLKLAVGCSPDRSAQARDL